MATKKSTGDMFTTAKEKAANDFELGKKMIDQFDAMLGRSFRSPRIRRIIENEHLHAGKWPEMELYLGDDPEVMMDQDGNGASMNLNDFIVHHPKMNNITNFIMGDIITQPLIPVIRDFSAHGRKSREEQRLKKTRDHYYQEFYAKPAEIVRQKYFAEKGNPDPMAMTPDEQKQVEADIQARIKAAIPKSVMDDLKKVKTPDEEIRRVLLEFDIKTLEIEEKFILGGEQAVVSYEEYYKLGRYGVKPIFEQLNTKDVTWIGSPKADYCEDGSVARHEEYVTVHDFIMDHGREAIKQKGFMKDIEKYFTEIPGYPKGGAYSQNEKDNAFWVETERDFVDAVGNNPGLITKDWRTSEGQQQIAGLYSALGSRFRPGFGIRKSYLTFKWTEEFTYVQRRGENGKIEEFIFSADYNKDKSKDIMCIKYPAVRVYHGYKIAERMYTQIEAVPWQYYGGLMDFQPKLTICGRRYGTTNGTDEDTTLMGPAIQFQLRYNVSASKLQDLETRDRGKTTYWNTAMRPGTFSEPEYIEMQLKLGNVPYQDTGIAANKGKAPVFVIDQSNTSKMEEYRLSMDKWEKEMYAAMRINKDAVGEASPYQSNAQTQSNINGSSKQLLPFYNKRRLLKQRILNYLSNISTLCLIEDDEKQAMLLDDLSRAHIQVNGDDMKAHATAIFVVDDYGEAISTERLKGAVVPLIQNMPVKDFIDMMKSKSISEMSEVAEMSEMKQKESADDAHNKKMQEIQANNEALQAVEKYKADKKEASELRRDQVDLALGEMDAMTMENAADVDKNKVADSIQRADKDNASKEKMNRGNNETKLLIAKQKAGATTK